MVELGMMNAQAPTVGKAKGLDGLLARYGDIFQSPTGLPPRRFRDHAIILKEGTEPISVCPYRYSQAQKDEIERLV